MSAPSLPSLVVSHWQPQWGPSVLGSVAAGIYLSATLRLGAGWPARRTISFLGGILCVLVALDSGIGGFDDRLLSAHMVQHMLLLLLAPLLLMAGQPLLLAL